MYYLDPSLKQFNYRYSKKVIFIGLVGLIVMRGILHICELPPNVRRRVPVLYRAGAGMSEDKARAMDQIYHERTARVRAVCKKFGKSAHFKDAKSVLGTQMRWLLKRDMAMCFIPKVGSTAWSQYLMKDVYYPFDFSAPFNEQRIARRYLRFPRDMNKNSAMLYLGDLQRVVAVRHPFVRITSAFLDKVKFCYLPGVLCVMDYESDEESFPKFIDMVLSEMPEQNMWKKYHEVNCHWRPFFAICAPCDIEYDYILKLETYEDDKKFIFDTFDLQVDENINTNTRNSTVAALEMFKYLNKSTVHHLYDHYRIDFEMFDYSLDGYMPHGLGRKK